MSSLNVLLIEKTFDEHSLKTILLAYNYHLLHLTLDAFDVERVMPTTKPDIVVLNIPRPKDTVIEIIQTLNHRYPLPIVLFSSDDNNETIHKVIKAGASAYVVDGVHVDRIKSIIEIAIVRFQQQQALKDELTQTKSKLAERKLIDQAKGILMKTKGFTEEEAYHSLRKLAMKRNVSIAEMAKNVMAMNELFSAAD